MIEYNGYIGTFEFEEKNQLFRGRVSNIADLVTFQGKSVKETQEAFKDAIDDYINWCNKYRKQPLKENHPLLNEKKNKKNGKDNNQNNLDTSGGGSN